MNCPTSKRNYATENIAEEALIQARIRFEHNKAIAVYKCVDCEQWHLTSKGEINANLKRLLQKGEINKKRDAMYWNDKFD